MENEFEIIGTVTSFIGKKGRLDFNSSNLAGKRRVMVTMVNDKNVEIKALLSSALSEQVRDKSITLGNLITFSYGKNELDHYYIVRPAGDVISVQAKDITAESIEAVDVDIEDYIAL